MAEKNASNRASSSKQGKILKFFGKQDSKFQSMILEKEDEQSPIKTPTHKKARNTLSLDVHENDMTINVDNIERDPGKRKLISEIDCNERDKVRHAYLKFGPYQPQLMSYALTKYTEKVQPRAFSKNWYKNEHCESWLEYSPHSDKAYCLYCYLFAKPNELYGDAFSKDGYNNWKSMLEKHKGITKHIGGPNSIHNQSVKAAKLLLQKNAHIINIFENVDSDMKEINMIRLRLLARISRHLAVQGLAFRGHDEKEDSFNRGNFLELLALIKGEAPELAKQIAKSPKNALYTSSDSQKDFIKATANLVQKYIIGEIGGNDVPYTIILDEARCAARKEWMALVVRWVDHHGDIQERFLDMMHVKDTTSQTLYNALMSLLLKHNLSPDMIRGQGFDGAANMRGEFNGLQAKIKEDYPLSWFVHCWAHKLNLVIVAICKSNPILCLFFLDIQNIYNIASASCKRRDMLRDSQAKKIAEQLGDGQLITGRGQNQEQNLQALSTTRWNCQLKLIENLRDMYDSSMEVIEWASTDATDSEKRAEALSTYERAIRFEFVLCMFLMINILSLTNSLSQYLQKKDQDILNAMRLVRITKKSIQLLRDSGWEDIKTKTVSFCNEHLIHVPLFNEKWVVRGRTRRHPAGYEPPTVENHYRIDLFNAVVDLTLSELNHLFSITTCELLSLTSYLDPSDNFNSYKVHQDKILKLAAMYTTDFKDIDYIALKTELIEFVMMVEDEENTALFEPVKCSLKELSRVLYKSKLLSVFPQLSKLIRLILTLPVSTATTERAFSAMKIIKTRLRTTMGDEWLVNLMIIYIEKGIAKSLDVDDIVQSFVGFSSRRLPIPK